jgi:hypothetical protein
MPEIQQQPSTLSEMPVTVLVECRQARSGRWVEEQWQAVAVVAGKDVAGHVFESTLVHEDDQCRRYLWSGLRLSLYKDGCESYWYNLMSEQPYLYVVCFAEEDEEGAESLQPVLVTADQQEATGHMETDDQVYAVPMPEQVHQWVERFVVENYVPEEKKKRKRTQWADQSRDGRGRAKQDARADESRDGRDRAKQDARAEESEHVETTEHDGSRPIRH